MGYADPNARILRCVERQWCSTHGVQLAPPPMSKSSTKTISEWFDLVETFAVDRNCGTLCIGDFERALQSVQITADRGALREMVQLADFDGDGSISRPEFYHLMSHEIAAGRNPMASEYVLPSGRPLALGMMFFKLRRRRMMAQILQGGDSRNQWADKADKVAEYVSAQLQLSLDASKVEDTHKRGGGTAPRPQRSSSPAQWADGLQEDGRRGDAMCRWRRGTSPLPQLPTLLQVTVTPSPDPLSSPPAMVDPYRNDPANAAAQSRSSSPGMPPASFSPPPSPWLEGLGGSGTMPPLGRAAAGARSSSSSPITLGGYWRGPQHTPLPAVDSVPRGLGVSESSTAFATPMSPRAGTFAPHPLGVFIPTEASIVADVLQAENAGRGQRRAFSMAGDGLGGGPLSRSASPYLQATVSLGMGMVSVPELEGGPGGAAALPYSYSVRHSAPNLNLLKTFQAQLVESARTSHSQLFSGNSQSRVSPSPAPGEAAAFAAAATAAAAASSRRHATSPNGNRPGTYSDSVRSRSPTFLDGRMRSPSRNTDSRNSHSPGRTESRPISTMAFRPVVEEEPRSQSRRAFAMACMATGTTVSQQPRVKPRPYSQPARVKRIPKLAPPLVKSASTRVLPAPGSQPQPEALKPPTPLCLMPQSTGPGHIGSKPATPMMLSSASSSNLSSGHNTKPPTPLVSQKSSLLVSQKSELSVPHSPATTVEDPSDSLSPWPGAEG